MYISLVFLIALFKETSGTFCSDVGAQMSIQVATFCKPSQASGNIVIVDGYSSFDKPTSKVCLCNAIVKIPETSSANSSIVKASAYFNLQPNYDACGSAVSLSNGDNSIRMTCSINGRVTARNNDLVQLRLLKETHPEDTRYCLHIHAQNPSASVSITCYEGDQESPLVTTTPSGLTTTTSPSSTITAASFSSSSSSLENSTVNSLSSIEPDQTIDEISTMQKSISTISEEIMTIRTSYNPQHNTTPSSTTLPPDIEEDDNYPLENTTLSSNMTEDSTDMFSSTRSNHEFHESTTEITTTVKRQEIISVTTTPELLTSTMIPEVTRSTSTPEVFTTQQLKTTGKGQVPLTTDSNETNEQTMISTESKHLSSTTNLEVTSQYRTTSESPDVMTTVQRKMNVTTKQSTDRRITTKSMLQSSSSSEQPSSQTSSKKPPENENLKSDDIPIEVVAPVSCIGGVILICIVICVAVGFRRNACGCNDDTQPLSNNLVDRVSVDIKSREKDTYVNPLYDDISLTGKSDYSDVESMMQELPSDDEHYQLPDTTKIDGELWTHL